METKIPAVRMRGITKTFGRVTANEKVDLDIYRGEILSLLGENGSGKTTLMNMLSGIYFPDEGEIEVDGRPVTIGSPKDAFDLGIGMIHQHFKLVDVLTAAENIILGLPGRQVLDLKAVAARIREICDAYGFEVDPNQKIYNMSVSQKQTVEIVKVLYRGADILILDEPTAVLTLQETEKLFAVLRNMRDAGKAIVLITHKLNEVEELSDRVVVLRHGKFVGDLVTRETNAQEMTNMMVGRQVTLNIARPDPVDPKPRLRVEGLTVRSSDGVLKLEDVSFTANSGEILGIAGISGSGQKELLEAIAGLQAAEKGSIRYIDDDGAESELLGCDPLAIQQKGVLLSFVPEDRLGMGPCRQHGPGGQHDAALVPQRPRHVHRPQEPTRAGAARRGGAGRGDAGHLHAGAPPLRRQRAEGARRARDLVRAGGAADGVRGARAGHQLLLHHLRSCEPAKAKRRGRDLCRRGP